MFNWTLTIRFFIDISWRTLITVVSVVKNKDKLGQDKQTIAYPVYG